MAANKETSVGIKLVADLRNYQKNITTAQKQTRTFSRNVKNNIGDVKSSFTALMRGDISQLPAFFKQSTTAAAGFAKGLNGVKAAMIATGIGALIVGLGVAIGALTQYFKGTEEGQIVFKKVMNNVKAYTEPVLQLFGKLGKALVHLFKGEFGKAWDTAKGAIKATGEQIKVNKENVDELNAAEEAYIKTKRKNLIANKKLEAEIAENRLIANNEEKYTAEQRRVAIEKAIAKQKELAANKRKELDLEIKIANIKASFGDNDIETNNELAQLEANKYEIIREQEKRLMMISETQQRINRELGVELTKRQEIAAAQQKNSGSYSTLESKTITTEFNSGPLETKTLDSMGGFLDQNAEKTKLFKEQLLELNDTQQAVVGSISGGFEMLAGNIVNSLGIASKGFEGFVSGLAQTIIKLVSMMLAQSLSTAIAGATQSGLATGPLAIFSTPAFIGTAVSGVLAAFASIPKFAAGGLAYGPTVGMMGEYAGARANPEVIAPLNKLKSLLPQDNAAAGPVEIYGETKIKDDHILIAYQRADQRQRNRT